VARPVLICDDEWERLNRIGDRIIDFYESGDYGIYLIKCNNPLVRETFGTVYQVAIKRMDMMFADYVSQFMRTSGRISRRDVEVAVNKIKEWVREYGDIAVVSFNERKMDRYKYILDRMGIENDIHTFYDRTRGGAMHRYIIIHR